MNDDGSDTATVRSSGVKPRRAHKKAKTGCADCRKRRVKCSEEKPQCRACCRRGVECYYPSFPAGSLSLGPSPATDETSPHPSSAQQFGQDCHLSPIPSLSLISCSATFRDRSHEQSAKFCMQDMALLHHWTVSTSLDVYKNSSLSITCQVTFPQIAFRYSFVMQALLALTSLHIAYLEPLERLRYTTDAARYHNEGLQGFKKAMHERSDEVADALFAWSSLNLFYVFAISGRLGKGIWEEPGAGDRKDRLLGKSYIPMIRGVQVVLMPSYDIMSQGALRGLLTLGNWDDIDPDKQLDAEDQCFCLTREVWENNPDAAIYEETLHILRRCRMFMAQFSNMNNEVIEESPCDRSWQGAFLFVPLSPEKYFTLLQQRQPPALILYAFYGALLHSTNDSWFMEGWGYDIVEVVDDLLGSYWRHWIAWPLEVVGLQLKN
ncbi:hypothetical protein FGRMN_2994 [Fusarium graminum]|nr:hypothetical protein FGRMN_2994 [Fusarium graminum]